MKASMLCRVAAVAVFVLASGGARAETVAAGPFSVEVSHKLVIRYNNTLLFSGDRCVPLRGLKPGAPSLVGDFKQGQVTRKDNVITLIVQRGRNSFRREVMVTPEAVHLTYEIKVFGQTGSTHLQYELLSPVETLDGTAYTAAIGLLRRPRKTITGVFNSAKSKPGKYIFQTGLYMALKSPSLECTLDFNPMGPWQGISNYGDNWSVNPYHHGKQYHFSMFCSAARNGATFTGKVIIRPGNKPYKTVHRNEPWSYTTDFPATLALNFSDSDANKRYQLCSATVPANKPFRWRPENIRIVSRAKGGLLRRDFAAAADGKSAGVLELKQPSGLYLLTFNIHDAKEDTGPFDISGPDGTLLQGIRIPRGQFWDKTVPIRFRHGKTALRFSGKWKINALALQLMLNENEDFLFERPYWNTPLAEPKASAPPPRAPGRPKE